MPRVLDSDGFESGGYRWKSGDFGLKKFGVWWLRGALYAPRCIRAMPNREYVLWCGSRDKLKGYRVNGVSRIEEKRAAQ